MTTTTANPSDMIQVAQLLKEFYPTHNLFNQTEDKIATYLQTESINHKLLICKNENKEIVASSFVVKTGESSDQSHSRWKFRHFAFVSEAAAKELLTASEDLVKGQSKTAKIELTISEREKSLSFFESNEYKKEGSLANHYRWNESCYILSKSFSK